MDFSGSWTCKLEQASGCLCVCFTSFCKAMCIFLLHDWFLNDEKYKGNLYIICLKNVFQKYWKVNSDLRILCVLGRSVVSDSLWPYEL